jgi:hypothetical protein
MGSYMRVIAVVFALGGATICAGCGLYVPEKVVLSPDHIDNPKTGMSSSGRYEDMIVRHIVCEIAAGIWDATQNKYFNIPWMKAHKWGTAATLIITAEDQSGENPGVSLIDPIENKIIPFAKGGAVTLSQSFSVGVGASGSANATRTETIQFTKENDLLWALAKADAHDGRVSCANYQNGIFVDSNLKIGQFIYDKAAIASLGNDANGNNGDPPFNTFTYDVKFVATFGGSITPTWKLARVSANPSGTLLSATRTNTNEVIITMGPIGSYESANGPAQLSNAAQNQHNAQVQGSATATAISGQ